MRPYAALIDDDSDQFFNACTAASADCCDCVSVCAARGRRAAGGGVLYRCRRVCCRGAQHPLVGSAWTTCRRLARHAAKTRCSASPPLMAAAECARTCTLRCGCRRRPRSQCNHSRDQLLRRAPSLSAAAAASSSLVDQLAGACPPCSTFAPAFSQCRTAAFQACALQLLSSLLIQHSNKVSRYTSFSSQLHDSMRNAGQG